MRLPQLTVDTLTDEQRELYDAIVARSAGRATSPSGVADDDGRLQGPFNGMLHNPALGRPMQQLGGVHRFRGALADRARELVILTVAAAHESEFEWWAHVRIGRAAGITDDEIAAGRDGTSLALDEPVERAVVDAARAVLADGDLDDEQYARLQALLGNATLLELLTLIGYYSMLAVQMRVLRVPLPEGEQPTWARPPV